MHTHRASLWEKMFFAIKYSGIGFLHEGRYFIYQQYYDDFATMGNRIRDEIAEDGALKRFSRMLSCSQGSPNLNMHKIVGASEEDLALCSKDGPLSGFLYLAATGGTMLVCDPNSMPLKESFQHLVVVDLDEQRLLVLKSHMSGRLRCLHLDNIPDNWLAALYDDTVSYGTVTIRPSLPHPAHFLNSAAAAMAKHGYQFVRWISQRSSESAIGEFISPSSKAVAVKCHYSEGLLCTSGPERKKMYRACSDREISVASMLLAEQSSKPDGGVVPILDIIKSEDCDSVLKAAFVMEKASFDLEGCMISIILRNRNIYNFDHADPILTKDALKICETGFFDKMLSTIREENEKQSRSLAGACLIEAFKHAKRAILELWNGLRWFHERDLLFIDMKASNVLVSDDGNWMLCDFETVCKLSSMCSLKRNATAAKLEPTCAASPNEKATCPSDTLAEQEDAPKLTAHGDARWCSGWGILKWASLTGGFHPNYGCKTVVQDYGSFGNLLVWVMEFHVFCAFAAESVVSGKEMTNEDLWKDLLKFEESKLSARCTRFHSLMRRDDSDDLLLEEAEALLHKEVLTCIDETIESMRNYSGPITY